MLCAHVWKLFYFIPNIGAGLKLCEGTTHLLTFVLSPLFDWLVISVHVYKLGRRAELMSDDLRQRPPSHFSGLRALIILQFAVCLQVAE